MRDREGEDLRFALGMTRSIYLPIDKPAILLFMLQPKTSASTSRQKEYARLCAQLAHIGWLSEGYVQNRGPGLADGLFGPQRYSSSLREDQSSEIGAPQKQQNHAVTAENQCLS